MHEDVDVGKVIVLVDDVSEVDHDFVPFVLGRAEGRGGVVDYVYRCANLVIVVEGVGDPAYVLLRCSCYDKHLGISCLGSFENPGLETANREEALKVICPLH